MTAPAPLPSLPVPPMPPPHPRLHPRPNGRGLRWPRRTIRLRLTLMYGAVFLLCGAALLAVTYFLTEHYAIRGPVVLKTHQIEGSASPGTSSPGKSSRLIRSRIAARPRFSATLI